MRRNHTPNGRSRHGPGFTKLYHHVIGSRHYASLSKPAKVLLIEFMHQYKVANNGDLCAAWGLLKDRGVGVRSTTQLAVDELERKGFIVRTRQGHNRSPNLYALSFFPIDECPGKRLERSPTRTPLDYWKDGANPEYSRAPKK